MTLTTPPPVRLLPHEGEPFVVYAIWGEYEGDMLSTADMVEMGMIPKVIYFSAANLPGGPLGEFAVSGSLAVPLAQVRPSELPIALSLRLATVEGREGPIGEWRFDFLGQSDSFARIWRIPPDVQPTGPTPLTLEELNQGAEEMVRESLGLPPEAPLPVPGGPLPPEEASEQPYVFDPSRHMDLSMAEAPPPLPPPAASGPEPAPGAAVYAGPALQPTQDKQHGAFGDASVPFAH
jgi:hypothetical protein